MGTMNVCTKYYINKGYFGLDKSGGLTLPSQEAVHLAKKQGSHCPLANKDLSLFWSL